MRRLKIREGRIGILSGQGYQSVYEDWWLPPYAGTTSIALSDVIGYDPRRIFRKLEHGNYGTRITTL